MKDEEEKERCFYFILYPSALITHPLFKEVPLA